MSFIRCAFMVRTPAAGGGYHYDEVMKMAFTTTCPPSVGDIVAVVPTWYRVIARQWNVPQPDSTWPSWAAPNEVVLILIVEHTDGVFADEAPRAEDTDAAAASPEPVDRKAWNFALYIPEGREGEIQRLLEENDVEVYRAWEVTRTAGEDNQP
ncbi:hypothetical protein ACFYUK_18865 [Nonomuraea wenchangensis]